MDRLTSLTVFGQVVESGGFSAAARRLNMSVTMVSNHVQSLEDRLGARLLNRTTRKVSLTEIGKTYYERSSQILLDLDEADRVASALHAIPQGTLRLYTNASIVPFLSPVVDEFLSRNPAVSVDLTIGERMVDLIEEGFDLAIRAVPPPESSLVARRLTPWRPVLCCAPRYLETHPTPVRPEDLAHHNCLQYTFAPYGNEWPFEDASGNVTTVRVSGNLVTNNPEALRHFALAGKGLLLTPSFVAVDDLARGDLVALLPGYRTREFAINALYPHRHHVSTKVRSFIDLLAERFAAHRRWMTLDGSKDDAPPAGANAPG
jgi:DNA-binding transcriptional LysR family regulator